MNVMEKILQIHLQNKEISLTGNIYEESFSNPGLIIGLRPANERRRLRD